MQAPRILLIAWLIFCMLRDGSVSFGQDGSPLLFETEVRPILKAHCFHCHGEGDHREAGLDVRLVHLLQKGGDSGPALLPGSATESLIYQRVVADEMPPGGKNLSPSQKETLERWLNAGAPTKRAEPEVPPLEEWTEEERSYWVFQPVASPAIPSVHPADCDSVRSPIDAWVLERLRAKEIPVSPDTDRATWIRRLSFTLLGVPPTFEEVAAFVADDNSDAYERLLDRLLADPRYGEHWGRHWLDVAGYADSDGYSEQDTERPWSWRYRDYVIEALNSDMPYDQFVIEQLAGDEIVPQPWDNLLPEQHRILAATGFLRTAPDGTGHEGVDQNVARNEVLSDTIKIVSSALLGLTVGCAQCHDHRYDPISQRDYYRMRALFEPGMDWKNWRDKNARLVNLWDAQQRQQASEVDKELSDLEAKRLLELDGIVDEIFEKEVMKLPEEQRDGARVARATPADQRSEEQKKQMRDFPSLNVDRGSAILYDGGRINEFNKKYEILQAEIKTKRPAEMFVACFSEVPNQVPTTFLFHRGDFQQPKDPIAPGGLSILSEQDKILADDPTVATSGRRLQFAKMLTQGVHPLVTRTAVNRLWMHVFGRALAANPGDLGMLGERPTHPELLDWLAQEWVRNGWSQKRLSRELLLSGVFRRSSARPAGGQDTDPENDWFGRMPIRRLQAESVRDAMLVTAGMLSGRMSGAPSAVNPDDVGQFIIGKATRDGNGILVAKQEETADTYRRSIYIQIRRSMPLGVLEPFDYAAMTPNCDRRKASTVATQSLMLMNNNTVVQIAEHFAQRVLREAGELPASQVTGAWRLAFGASPSDSQVERLTQWLSDLRTSLCPPNSEQGDAPKLSDEERGKVNRQALALMCQAILSSNAFLYVD